MSMKRDLKKIFLDRVSKMPDNAGTSLDRNIRKMSKNANRDFDKIWVKYNNGNATYKEWESALDKWFKLELL